jgi:NADPH-dependent curcumin reductase CurA
MNTGSSTMDEMNRVWRLRKRPVGSISDDVLSFDQEPIPVPGPGQFLVRLNYLSLDPTNRIWMSDADHYMPPLALGDPMRGVICGTVVESQTPEFAPGDRVSGIGAVPGGRVRHAPQVRAPGRRIGGRSVRPVRSGRADRLFWPA